MKGADHRIPFNCFVFPYHRWSGVFVALGLEWTGPRQIRSATLPEQVRERIGILRSASRLLFFSMLTSAFTGIISMLIEDGLEAWITVTLRSLFLIIVLVMSITGPRMAVVGRALATEKGSVSQTFHNLLNHPILWISIQTRVAIVLGIILLKFTKPNLGASLLTIGVAIILGVASALPISSRVRVQEGPAD